MRLIPAIALSVALATCSTPPSPRPAPASSVPSAAPSEEAVPSNPFGLCEPGNRSALVDGAEIVRDPTVLGQRWIASGRLVSDMCEGSVVVSLDRMGLVTNNGLRICAAAQPTADATARYNATPFPFTLSAQDVRTIVVVFDATLPTTGPLELQYDERTPCVGH